MNQFQANEQREDFHKARRYLEGLAGEWALWYYGDKEYRATYAAEPSQHVCLGEYFGEYEAEGDSMEACLILLANNVKNGVTS